MRVELGPQIDVALRAAQRPEVLPDVLRIGIAGEHRRNHEGGVDDLAETELLDEVVRPAEERRSGYLAVDQPLQAREQDAVGERELDLVGRKVLLERLER